MTTNMSTNTINSVCPVCGRSRTLEGATFAHVRPGLDEAPEPVWCKCRPMNVVVNEIMNNHASTLAAVETPMRTYMNTIPPT